MTEAQEIAGSLRWAVSRLSKRLRTEHPSPRSDGPEPLTRLSASLLATLRHDGSATVTELAEGEGLQPQSLTRTVQTLEAHGYVSRARDAADRRATRIALTDEGRAALDDHVADGNRWLADAMVAVLTPAECRVLDVAATLMTSVCTHPSDPVRARIPGSAPAR